jgi:rhodanese-related sulfurtransferase
MLLALAFAPAMTPAAMAQAPTVQDSVSRYLANLPSGFNTISVAALKAKLDAGQKPFILDVREPNEYAAGHVDGAVSIPIRTLGENLTKLPAAKDAEIVVICASGIRAAYGTMALAMLGYTNAKDMASGMQGWNAQGFPVVK